MLQRHRQFEVYRISTYVILNAESSDLSLPEFTEQMEHVLFLVSQLQGVKGQMSGIQYGALKNDDTSCIVWELL